MIRVSALVSTYRAQYWIASRLDNLLAQTLGSELEIIVIDSGSPENEQAVVARYQAIHSNIQLIRSPRESLYAAWNRGIAIAGGRYLTNANTDDRLLAHGLETLADTLDSRPEVALVYPDYYTASTPQQVLAWGSALQNRELGLVRREVYSHRDLLLRCLCGPFPMWRAMLHESLGLFDPSFEVSGDWDFWLRAAERYPLLHLPEPLGIGFANPHGLERSSIDRRLREDLEVRRRHYTRPSKT